MPTTPGVTINDQAMWDRVMAAFGTLSEFNKWNRTALQTEVIRREMAALDQQATAQKVQKLLELRNAIDPPPPPPPPGP